MSIPTPLVIVRQVLVALPGLAGVNIAASPQFAQGYTIAPDPDREAHLSGDAVLLNIRGGQLDASTAIRLPSFQFLSYGQDEARAEALGLVIWNGLFEYSDRYIKATEPQSATPRLLWDTDMSAYFALQFWQIDIRRI